MTKKISDSDFSQFRIDNLASVNSGIDIYDKERKIGDTPYVTSGTANNGIGYFVGNDNASKASHLISVNRNGAVGEAFYHPYTALFGNDCRTIRLNGKQAPNSHLFVAKMIANQKKLFSYSRKLGTARLKRLNVMLPVNEDNSPDYSFMSDYVQDIKDALLKKYKSYLKKRIKSLGELKPIVPLDEKEWRPFDFIHIFDQIRRGKRLKKADHIKGNTPYVSSTAMTNGNDGTCGNTRGVRKFSNCLTIANSGSVGSCFYHPYEFVASDHVTALIKDGASEPLYLGLSLLAGRIGEKYNFNREINDARISRERIMLPVDDEGNPDYDYIEQYAKNMMIKKYRQYLAYLESRKTE